VAIDSKGDVVLAGTFTNPTIDFGGGPLTLAGSQDIFLAKLNHSTGDQVYSKSFGNNPVFGGIALGLEPTDEILLGGHATTPVDFGKGPLVASTPNSSSEDAVIAKFAP
jgi:hypothetical protein